MLFSRHFLPAIPQRCCCTLSMFISSPGKILFDSGDIIDAVYFPTSAVVSLVVGLSTGETVEGAMVGKGGVVGVAAALDSKIALAQAIVQLSGDAFVCDASAFKGIALQSEKLFSLLFRHEQAVYAQTQQSTACRNFWPRCWGCVEPALRSMRTLCKMRD
jgi:hypothetical protein